MVGFGGEVYAFSLGVFGCLLFGIHVAPFGSIPGDRPKNDNVSLGFNYIL